MALGPNRREATTMALTRVGPTDPEIRSEEPAAFEGIGIEGWLALVTIAAVTLWLVASV